MFARCLFCHGALGANDVVEAFPVGRRLAFDAAQGRLWVVCPRCGQWNLTPLEERWEAIEDCERRFRDARKRVVTDEIGLARVGRDVDLIRIGRPLRPEFAAWRYGERLRRRRLRTAVATGAAAVLTVGTAALGFTTGMFLPLFADVVYAKLARRNELAAARAFLLRNVAQRLGEEPPAPATRWHRLRDMFAPGPEFPAELHLVATPDEQRWGLRIVRERTLDLTGPEALQASHLLLPAMNAWGATTRTLDEAVRELEGVAEPSAYFPVALQRAREKVDRWTPISGFPSTIRLALEMAAHEEAERRAMEGELDALAEAWREAEEIAAIADGLLLPDGVTTRLAALKRGANPPAAEAPIRDEARDVRRAGGAP